MTIPLREGINSYIMNIMKRRVVLILIGLLVVGIATFFYIDNIFLPIQFKRFVTTKAEKLLQRRVSVKSIDFRPIQGFIIKNILISRKDDPAKPFIRIGEITFNLLLAPIFQKKAIILPSIKIKNPYAYLSRDKNKAWNFSDLSDLAKRTKAKNSFSVLLRKLTLEGGTIHYKDVSQNQEFLESIENIRLNTTLSLNKGIRFVFQAQIPERKTTLKIKGNYGLLLKKLTAQILADNIYLARYLPLSYTSQPYVHLTGGVISSADFGVIYAGRKLQVQGSFLANKTGLQAGKDKQIRGTVYVPTMLLTWHDNKWNAKGHLQLLSVRMASSDGKEFQGDIKADLNLLTVFKNNMTSQGNVTIDNAHLILDENRYFKGNITATNASLVKGDGKIRLQGNFDIEKTDITIGKLMSLKGDLSTTDTNLTWFRNGSGTNKFNMQSGFTMNDAQATLGKDRSISSSIHVHAARISFNRAKMIVEALGRLDTANIRLTENKRFEGSPYFNIFCQYDPKQKKPVDYKGTLRFTESTFTGIPYLDTIKNINGIVAIMPDHIQTDRLTFDTQETNIRLSGLLIDFSKLMLNINASSKSIDLQKVMAIFPVLKETAQIDLTGQALVNANYNGPALSPSDAAITLSARLADATLTHEKLPEAFTGISGRLNYKKNLIEWLGLQAHYRGKAYTFNGQLNNFSRPAIDTEIIGDQLKLSARIKLLRSALKLTSFTGHYLNSSFDLKGDAHFFDDAPADIDLRGKFSLNLKDAGILVPRLKHRFDQFKPVGILAGKGIYKGTVEDWRDWQLALDMKSDKVTVDGYPFENVSIRFTQRDLAISKCNVSSKIYGGDLTVTSAADLRGEEVPFTANIDLKGLDLSQFREDKKMKNRQLAGTLSLLANLKGEAGQWRELTGKGSLNITDGHLWRWNILDGMSKILLIPEFKNFVFTEAGSDFYIKGQKAFTNNARMTSTSVSLAAKGWIDFHKNLNFDINPTFSKLAILQSESLKKGITSILTQTDGYLNIKLTGTLDEPRYHVEKSPLKILGGTIRDTTDTLKEVLGGILEEIFN